MINPNGGSRARALEIVLELAGPIGPMGSVDAREAQRRAVASEAPDWLLEGLLSILVDRPELPATVNWAEVELEIVDLLSGLSGRRDLLPRLVPLLDDPCARPAVIEALGSIGDSRAVEDLKRIYDRGELDSDELTRLACALGEISGDAAVALLRRIAAAAGTPPEVRAEAELALQHMDGSDRPDAS